MYLLKSYILAITDHYSLKEQDFLHKKLISLFKELDKNLKYTEFLSSLIVSVSKKIIFCKELLNSFELQDDYLFKIIELLLQSYGSLNILKFLKQLIISLEQNLNQETIKIYSLYKFSFDQKQQLELYFQNKFQKQLFFKYFLDLKIKFGFKIIYQDKVLDNTLVNQFACFSKWYQSQQ